MIEITLKDTQTGAEVFRRYATDMFATVDTQKIGEKVWCMYETASEPYKGEFYITENPNIDNETDRELERRADMAELAHDAIMGK